MKPYRITKAILTTYSGKKHSVDLDSEILTKPVRIIKEKLLDGFCAMCSNSTDPFVKIEVVTKPLFNVN